MAKRLMAVIMVLLMLFSSVGTVGAEGVVYVSVENATYAKADGAPWEGLLIERYAVAFEEGDTMQTVLKRTFKEKKISSSGIDDGYITEIEGISAGSADIYSGWMVTLNDWFTNCGISDMTVRAGDEIKCVHSCNMGADVGSDWVSTDTSLKSLKFSEGEIDFLKNVTEYELVISDEAESICVYPVASNKNYQVRIYKNTTQYVDTFYRAGEKTDIKDGDVLYIACGLSGWPSMNTTEGGTVYKVKIKAVSDIDIPGDGVTVSMDESGKLTILSDTPKKLKIYAVCYTKEKIVDFVKTTDVTESVVYIGNDFDKLIILDEKLVPVINPIEVNNK